MAFADDAPVHLLKKKSQSRRSAASWQEIGSVRKYYRSRWEANFARYLEWLKTTGIIKSWKHEPKTFWFKKIQRGVRSYKPDFMAVYKDGSKKWFEVKGWMDPRSSTKLKRMAKYYPEVNLLVIDSKWFAAQSPMLSGIVPGWEIKNV